MRNLAIRLLIATFLPLAGCVILPVPIPASGTSARDVAAGLEVGVTDRSQVHERFGPPGLVIGEHHELFDLEVDPFHFWILAAFGGPGYASGDAFRTGETQRYGLAVAYDEADRVKAWRVLLPGTGVSNTADGRLGPPPDAPSLLERWRSDHVQFLSEEALVLLRADPGGSLNVTMIDPRAGTTIRTLAGTSEGCGNLKSATAGGAFPLFGLSHGRIVSVPRRIDASNAPCLWTLDDVRGLVASRLDQLIVPDVSIEALLVGDAVLRKLDDESIDSHLLSNAVQFRLAMPWPPLGAAADTSSGRMVLRTASSEPSQIFWLLDQSERRVEPIPELAGSARHGCTGRLAISPGGQHLGLHCGRHLEVWQLPTAVGPARLVELLPLPEDVAGPDLAFSPDGRRLVLGSRGIVVWRTVDWSIEAFLSGDDMQPEEIAQRVALNTDATRIATRTALWQLGGDATAAQSARP